MLSQVELRDAAVNFDSYV